MTAAFDTDAVIVVARPAGLSARRSSRRPGL